MLLHICFRLTCVFLAFLHTISRSTRLKFYNIFITTVNSGNSFVVILEYIEDLKEQHLHIYGRHLTETGRKLKNGIFREVMPCSSCKNRRFGGT
jgi:hypothetical protein